MPNDPFEIEGVCFSWDSVEVSTDVVFAQSHSRLGPFRGTKPGGPERELCDGVHAGHRAPRGPLGSRHCERLGITGLCGGKKTQVQSYLIISARSDMQESPDHRAPTSAFTEVDLDH